MRHFLPVLVTCLLLSAAANAKPPELSVAGLTAGMTIDAVSSKLGPTYHKEVTAIVQSGDVVNFTNGLEGFNVLAMGGKIIYIEHQQMFAPKGLISADELAKALTEKYGPPSIKNSDDQSEAWIVADDKIVPADGVTDQQRACLKYETQGPFFAQTSSKTTFAFVFPRVPQSVPLTGCNTVIVAHPSLVSENTGLVSQLTVSLFDVKAAQAWYDDAMAEYNKKLKDAVDAARKNKPNL